MVERVQTRMKDSYGSIKKHEKVFPNNETRFKSMGKKIDNLEDILVGVGQNVKNIS